MESYDVVIVGAGMVGLCLASALGQQNFRVALVDSQHNDTPLKATPENRVSAISQASVNILTRLGAWQALPKERLQAYARMHVWEQDSFAKIDFDSPALVQGNLGYIAENQAIRLALLNQTSLNPNVTMHTGKTIEKLVFGQKEAFLSLSDDTMLTATLVVGADGANSFVRRQANLPMTFWDYDHQAIVATVNTEIPHQACARQVFTPTGPLALLPLWQSNQCSIVWSQQSQQAQTLMALNDEDFNKALTVAFDGKLGQLQLESQRQAFPLTMRYVRQWCKDRVVVIGDAAHTIHPLAGQGVNLGFADVAALVEQLQLLREQGKDFGLQRSLREFERWRKSDAMTMIAAMEGFKHLFSGRHPVKKLLRDVGLSLTDKLPPLKDRFMRQAMGLEGQLPALAKPLTLDS